MSAPSTAPTIKDILATTVKNGNGTFTLTEQQQTILIDASMTLALYNTDTSPNKISNLCNILNKYEGDLTKQKAVANSLVAFMQSNDIFTTVFTKMIELVGFVGTNRIQMVNTYIDIRTTDRQSIAYYFLAAWSKAMSTI